MKLQSFEAFVHGADMTEYKISVTLTNQYGEPKTVPSVVLSQNGNNRLPSKINTVYV